MSEQGTLAGNQVMRALATHPLTVAQRTEWKAGRWEEQPEAWGPFVEAWLDRGLRLPPEGDPRDDPDTSLRSRLWPIAEARPNDLGRWVREAKGRTVHQIIGHVFRQWRGILNDLPDDDWAAFDEAKRASRYDPGARPSLSRIRDVLEAGR